MEIVKMNIIPRALNLQRERNHGWRIFKLGTEDFCFYKKLKVYRERRITVISALAEKTEN